MRLIKKIDDSNYKEVGQYAVSIGIPRIAGMTVRFADGTWHRVSLEDLAHEGADKWSFVSWPDFRDEVTVLLTIPWLEEVAKKYGLHIEVCRSLDRVRVYEGDAHPKKIFQALGPSFIAAVFRTKVWMDDKGPGILESRK